MIDFMLAEPFQSDVPLSMFVYPVREGTALPAEFGKHALVPRQPLTLAADRIDAGRDRWIDEWTEIVLR